MSILKTYTNFARHICVFMEYAVKHWKTSSTDSAFLQFYIIKCFYTPILVCVTVIFMVSVSVCIHLSLWWIPPTWSHCIWVLSCHFFSREENNILIKSQKQSTYARQREIIQRHMTKRKACSSSHHLCITLCVLLVKV